MIQGGGEILESREKAEARRLGPAGRDQWRPGRRRPGRSWPGRWPAAAAQEQTGQSGLAAAPGTWWQCQECGADTADGD